MDFAAGRTRPHSLGETAASKECQHLGEQVTAGFPDGRRGIDRKIALTTIEIRSHALSTEPCGDGPRRVI